MKISKKERLMWVQFGSDWLSANLAATSGKERKGKSTVSNQRLIIKLIKSKGYDLKKN